MTILRHFTQSPANQLPDVSRPAAVLPVEPEIALAHALLRLAAILDHSKVSVKPGFLPCFGVPGIKHYETVRKEVVRLLCEERERRELSNYAVSQRSGVSESMLSLVERGLRNPTMELMLRMADGIGANLPAIIDQATRTVKRKDLGKPTLRKRRAK